MPTEVEIKLAVAAADLARLRRHPLLRAVRPRSRRLYSVYFDTASFALFARRAAFRLRREGYHWVQTLKLDPGSVGGLSARPEWEQAVAGKAVDLDILPAEARAQLAEVTGDALQPLFETDFRRTTWRIERPDGVVEVAIDVGEVRHGGHSRPLCEVELELKGGERLALFDTALALLEAAPLVPEFRSKALRGYALAGAWSMAPSRAVAADVGRHLPAPEAWRRMLLSALEQFTRNLPGLLEEDDPEYLHQTRVAVRRLRAVLALGKSLDAGLDPSAWVEALRRLMAELSPARDWDVLVTETLPAVYAGLPQAERLDAVVAAAARRRLVAGQQARAAVRDPRLLAVLLEIGRALDTPCTGGPDWSEWAAAELQRRWRRFRRLARDYAELDAGGRHRLRILGKRLRYAGEAFAPFYGRRGTRFLARLGRLQTALGAANDAHVAGMLLAGLAPRGRPSYDVGLIEGFLAGRAEPDRAAGLLRRLLRVRRFWH